MGVHPRHSRKHRATPKIALLGTFLGTLGVVVALGHESTNSRAAPAHAPASQSAPQSSLAALRTQILARALSPARSPEPTSSAPAFDDEDALPAGAGNEAEFGAEPIPTAALFAAEEPVERGEREQRLTELFEEAQVPSALLGVECRETLCRLEIALDQINLGDPAFQNLEETLSQTPRGVALEDRKAIVLVSADALDV